MNGKRTPRQQLETLVDDATEAVRAISGRELRRLIEDSGREFESEVAWVSRIIESNIEKPKESLIELSRQALKRRKHTKTSFKLPDSAETRRRLLERLKASPERLPPSLTMAFRDVDTLSDGDIAGILEDLGELGLLDSLDDDE